MAEKELSFYIPFNAKDPPWKTAKKPWTRSLCQLRYVYSFIEGDQITLAQLAEESGMSLPSLSRWSTADSWRSQRLNIDSHINSVAIAEANKEESDDNSIMAIDPQKIAAREEILKKVGSIADEHIEAIHAAIEVQKKHVLLYKQKREIAAIFQNCFIHVLTRVNAGAAPDERILETLNEMMKRGGRGAVKTYSDMMELAIAGEERIYGLNQMRDLRAAEATLASAGYAIVEAKALQEAKQLEAGEIEGEIVEEKA